jgi:glycosyltransferase involved in cell wall biosynthesis
LSVSNGQAFLSEAIESILGQIFRDPEFLVIHDRSADKTCQIISTYASRDPRAYIYHDENKGRAESLYIGISLAKGNHIASMDDADIDP